MARLELIQPYEMHVPGTVIELPGGVASVLIASRIAKLSKSPVCAVPADIGASVKLAPKRKPTSKTRRSKNAKH